MFLKPLLAIGVLLSSHVALADPPLIGGSPADPKDWPASVYASMNGAACSATVIGSRTLLIAAHCVSNGKTATFTAGGNRYVSTCEHHPAYRSNSTADWTLCLTDKPVAGVTFESINVNPAVPALGGVLRLTGYGCVRPGGGGGNDGVFRIGLATVTQLAKPALRDYDIVTKGGAALCFGDSGGAAYLESGSSSRVIVGVNSRGDIATTSYLPAYATDAFKGWALDWSARKSQKICGLDPTALGCRNGSPGPQLPVECNGMAPHLATWTKCLTATQMPTGCEATHKAMHACYDARTDD